MTSKCQNPSRPQRRLPIAWQDCAWFPPVLAGKRGGSARRQRRVYWPVQIITDPTVCASRALDPDFMKTSPVEFRPRAFTLIELLVVIAIIAILAAMLFPAIGVAKKKASEASARADMQNIALAIGRYEADYNGRFPAPGVQTGVKDVTYGFNAGTAITDVTAFASNWSVIAILLDLEYTKEQTPRPTANTNHVLNPRRIANLNAKYVNDISSGGVGPDLEYRDPWGSPYVISMDTSLDDRVRDHFYTRRSVSQDSGAKGLFGLSNPSANANSDEFVFNGKFMIWSLGADRKASFTQNPTPPPFGGAKTGDNRDNLLSWQ
jgi:prepilin-type N-terminal cleavage/methylation domain-containing protein